jgi:hypothetical protein
MRFILGKRSGQPAGKVVNPSTKRRKRGPEYSEKVALTFGNRSARQFGSLEEATAHARHHDSEGAAVVEEDGHYVIYQLNDE